MGKLSHMPASVHSITGQSRAGTLPLSSRDSGISQKIRQPTPSKFRWWVSFLLKYISLEHRGEGLIPGVPISKRCEAGSHGPRHSLGGLASYTGPSG